MCYARRVVKWLAAFVCMLAICATPLSIASQLYHGDGEFLAKLKLTTSQGEQWITGLVISPNWVLTLKQPLQATLKRGGRISLQLGYQRVSQHSSEAVFVNKRSPVALIKLDQSFESDSFPSLLSTPLYSSENLPDAVIATAANAQAFFAGQMVVGFGDRAIRVDGSSNLEGERATNQGGPWFFDSPRGVVIFAVSQGGDEAVQTGYSQVRNWIQRTVVKHSDDQLHWLGKHRLLNQ